MHRVDRSPSWCRVRSVRRRPPLRTASRPTARDKVKTTAVREIARVQQVRSGASPDAVVAVKLARGNSRKSKSAQKARAEVASAQAVDLVQTVEIRPSGRVISRRNEVRRTPIHHLPHHPVVPFTPPAWMLEECQVAPARAGEQSEILQLLSGLPTPPTRAEFHAAVDHPDHDSANRLVARLGGRIVGHAEVAPREIMIGPVSIRGAVMDRVAVLQECRGAGHGQRLVKAG